MGWCLIPALFLRKLVSASSVNQCWRSMETKVVARSSVIFSHFLWKGLPTLGKSITEFFLFLTRKKLIVSWNKQRAIQTINMKWLITTPKSNQHVPEKHFIVRHWAEQQHNQPKVTWGMPSQALFMTGQLLHQLSLNIFFEYYSFWRFILIIRSLMIIVFVVLNVALEIHCFQTLLCHRRALCGGKKILKNLCVLPICYKGREAMAIKKLKFSLGTGKDWKLEQARGRACLPGIVFTKIWLICQIILQGSQG